jgi:hypothetical protein
MLEGRFTMSLKGSMLEMEEKLQEKLNEAGCAVGKLCYVLVPMAHQTVLVI